jgi:tRNA(Leu) C34 or U34 (ribose-2'-O)-methylase TrmL
MELKDYIIKEFSEYVVRIKKSLRILKKIDTNNADYEVTINSSWHHEGEKDTATKHHGTLKEAIEKAEEEFKKVNSREDVQGDYHPHLVFGEESYSIPEMFWKKYIQRKD